MKVLLIKPCLSLSSSPMATFRSQTTRQKPKAAVKTLRLDAAGVENSPLSLKRLDPLTAVSIFSGYLV